jgi:hypothetical protein
VSQPSETQSNTPLPDSQTWPPYIDDYAFTMSGGHRKPAYDIGAPSISWHTGFWKPSKKEYPKDISSEGTRSRNRRKIWVTQIERLVLEVYDNLHQHKARMKGEWRDPTLTNLQPDTSDRPDRLHLFRGNYPRNREAPDAYTPGELDPDRPQTRYETVHIDGVWNSMPLDIRFEVNGEFFTITTTIDFSRMRPQPAFDETQDIKQRAMWERRRRIRPGEFVIDFSVYVKTASRLNKVIDLTEERFRAVRGRRVPKDWYIEELKSDTKFLYFDLWEMLKKEIFYGSKDNEHIARLGKCFADFRNLTLQCTSDGLSLINPWRKSEQDIDSDPYALAPTRKDWPLRNEIVGHTFEDDDIEWVDAIHPILLSLEQPIVNTHVDIENHPNGIPLACDPVEYTFTKFCEGRCIYGSGFGPQVKRRRGSGEQSPLPYILLFGFDENRQMGRHLQREHTVGTLRLAALHDLQDTKQKYDHQLNDINEDLDTLQTKLSEQFARVYGKDSETASSDDSSVTKASKGNEKKSKGKEKEERTREINQLLNKIHQQLDELDSEGLVTFRAMRSRLFRERFGALAPAMKSSDIRGYQPYHVFMEHRLNRAYSIMQVVADHYSQLREKERRLRREWMALQSEEHQKVIVDIGKIQDAAEILFFLVLFPYYVSHTVIAAIESKGQTSYRLWTELHLDKLSHSLALDSLWTRLRLDQFAGWVHRMMAGEPDKLLVVAASWTLGIALLLLFKRKKVAKRTKLVFNKLARRKTQPESRIN